MMGTRLKKMKVEEAVGRRLAHDLTRIIRGKFKGAAFRKGHRVRPEDLPSNLHTHACVFPGQVVAGTRAIPLTISESRIRTLANSLDARLPFLYIQPIPNRVVIHLKEPKNNCDSNTE